MRMRSLVMMLALTLVAGVAYADTICVPAPATTTTTTTVSMTDVDQFNTSYLSSCFGIPTATIADLRQRHDWGTIYFVANVAAKTGRPITEIASLAEQGMTWNDIACKYGMTLASLTTVTSCPSGVRTAAYPATYGAGSPIGRSWVSDRYGNVVLTQREARRLACLGYTCDDIAIATNIAMRTGDSVENVLQWQNRGLTWQQTARYYGVNWNDAKNIESYPFSGIGGTCSLMGAGAGAGAGPCPPEPCPNPCEQPATVCPPSPCPPGAGTGAGPAVETVPAPTTPSTY